VTVSKHWSRIAQSLRGNQRSAPPGSQKPLPSLNPSPSSSATSKFPEQLGSLSTLLQRTILIATATVSVALGAGLVLTAPLFWNEKGELREPHLAALFQNGLQYQVTRSINILVMGIDRVPEAQPNSNQMFSGRSDTMLLVRLDPDKGSASLLSIPRDTQVEIPGIGLNKINEANVVGGPALTRQVVSKTLNQVPIDRYVRVSTGAFRALVDQLGGIDVFVPFPMSYEDKTQKLKIDLNQGQQVLNGQQAEQFARFRHDGFGDVGRVQRQQILLKALRQKLTNPMVVTQVPGIVNILRTYVDTNLSPEEMLALAQFATKLDQKQVKMVMLPGQFSTPEQFSASYWLMDETKRDRILQDYFQFAPATSPATAQDSERPLEQFNIAIQNASELPGMGRRVANYLQEKGFQNVYVVEDWPAPLNTTHIVVEKGDLQGAEKLQQLLGLGEAEHTSTGDIESDLTLRLGKDWANHKDLAP
jgi:polyisoprenyl-teichoic acid--peptidoglycan teichoic acid transferase